MTLRIHTKLQAWLQIPDKKTKCLCKSLDAYITTPQHFDLAVYQDALSHVSATHHKKLAAKISAVFQRLNQENRKIVLKSLCEYAIEHQNFLISDELGKIVSLEQVKLLYGHPNLEKGLKIEAKITKKPLRQFEMLQKNISNYVSSHIGIVGKAINYLATTAFLSISINFDKVPKTQQEASMQIYVIMGIVTSITTSTAYLSSLCSSALAISFVALGTIALVGIVYFLYKKIKIGKPDNLNRHLFRNLNQEAKQNDFQSGTIGRGKELEELETALSARHGDVRPVPILIGPPGVGKSQLVEGLATRIAKGQSKALLEKQILMINSASLSGTSYSMEDFESLNRLEMIYRQLQGHEDDFILFFDEAHTLATISSAPFSAQGASLLEVLKSKLLEVPVQCIFATTDEEYNRHIAQDRAFVSRLKRIDLKPFSRQDAKSFLLHKYSFDQSPSISEEVIEKVLDVIKETDHDSSSTYNPRKAEHVIAALRNTLLAWRPKKLESRLEGIIQQMKSLEENAKLKMVKNQTWLQSNEGRLFSSQFERLEAQKTLLENKIQDQNKLIRLIDKMSEEISSLTAKRAYYIHAVADANTKQDIKEEALKQYLLINNLVIPSLKEALATKKQRLKDDFSEEVPCDITVSMVDNLYPQKAKQSIGVIQKLTGSVFQNIKSFYQRMGNFFS